MQISPKSDNGPRLYRGVFPSVTTVLGILKQSYFEDWARKVGIAEARRVAREAAEFGTAVHIAARDIALGIETGAPEELAPYAAAIENFLEEHVSEVLETELELVSPRLKFGGTLDLYCRLKDGSYAVIDWKTTAQLTRQHGLQTAAYAILLHQSGRPVQHRIVVRIKKEKPGAYYCRHYLEHRDDQDGFLGALRVWWWEHGPMMRKKGAA